MPPINTDRLQTILPGKAWLHKIRLRVLAVLVAGVFAVIGVVSWAALPVLPVVGVAVITVAAVVNSMTSKVNARVCHNCGEEIEPEKPGTYGVICQNCGAISGHDGLA